MNAHAAHAQVAALEHALEGIAADHSPAAFASSLGAEDMVITDVIARRRLGIGIFTLDTGRLHADTLDLIGAIRERYGIDVDVVRPAEPALRQYIAWHGRDAFYESVELRKRCCEIRKVEPLHRALAGNNAWITGMRREQSMTRAALPASEYDAVHGMKKFNPLADWSEHGVWEYLRAFDVPYNRLHDQGYRSIGCAPCTRPTVAGEDVRAGRWWWEAAEARECGLHLTPEGRLVRKPGLGT